MMRGLTLLLVAALVATLATPVLAGEAERSVDEIGTGIDEFAAAPPPALGDGSVVAESEVCAVDDLECAIRAQHMNSGQETD